MSTLAQHVAGLVPESSTVPELVATTSIQGSVALGFYGQTSEDGLTEVYKSMVAHRAALLLLPAIIDHYKSRITRSKSIQTDMEFRDRMTGLEALRKMLEDNLETLEEVVLGTSLPEAGYEKVVEDDNFYQS